MLSITKSSTNTIAVTVKERTTLVSPYYLFEFISDSSTPYKYCIGTEVSTTWEDRSKFTITETTNPDNTAGEILLSVGDYHYNIYEQASSTNLDPTGLTLVEEGLATCFQTATANKEYEADVAVNKVYNG